MGQQRNQRGNQKMAKKQIKMETQLCKTYGAE